MTFQNRISYPNSTNKSILRLRFVHLSKWTRFWRRKDQNASCEWYLREYEFRYLVSFSTGLLSQTHQNNYSFFSQEMDEKAALISETYDCFQNDFWLFFTKSNWQNSALPIKSKFSVSTLWHKIFQRRLSVAWIMNFLRKSRFFLKTNHFHNHDLALKSMIF